MRIALIAPYSLGPLRGNIITVNRIGCFLQRLEVDVLILPADALSSAEMEQRLASFAPRLIHAFHARYCGGVAQRLAERLHLPYVVTITGSDLHDPQLRDHPDTLRALSSARSVICFNDLEAAKLAGHFPEISARLSVIPQGVEALPVAEDDFGVAGDAFVLLLPAALRPVKRVEFPLQALAPLMERLPALRLVIAGGIIDQDYAATIRTMLCDAPYAAWLGEVARERMGALYARADVVLNCSLFESMPNSLLEAMALGRPVLAADIAGNRALVRHGDTGLLYRDDHSFFEGVMRLAQEPELRAALGRHAQAWVQSTCSPQLEAAAYLSLYRSLLV